LFPNCDDRLRREPQSIRAKRDRQKSGLGSHKNKAITDG
jgi:hypothetical protein